jgi:Dual specificity phosphatase, catalytic domain
VHKQAEQSPIPDRPLPNSYWVIPTRLLAGEHPAGEDAPGLRTRLQHLHLAGIDCYVDLTEAGERPEYRQLLPQQIEYLRSPIPDMQVPHNVSQTQSLLANIRRALAEERRVYVHCRAGIGRTGLIIGCFLAEEERSGRSAIKRLNQLWRQSARSATWPRVPQTSEQADYIRRWTSLRERGAKS